LQKAHQRNTEASGAVSFASSFMIACVREARNRGSPRRASLSRVRVMARGVRSRLGLEGRGQDGYFDTEADEHFGQDVIGGKPKPACAHFDGRVAIAQMIGRARERLCILRARLHQGLLGALHAHDSSIVRNEALTAAQDGAAVQKEPTSSPPTSDVRSRLLHRCSNGSMSVASTCPAAGARLRTIIIGSKA
jgi:hypothetical protein